MKQLETSGYIDYETSPCASSQDRMRPKRRRRLRDTVTKSALYIALSLVGITMFVPFLWMISTSLREQGAVFAFPPRWIPHPAVWENYLRAWQALPFARFYFNSVMVGIAVTLGQVLTSSFAAYAFARLRFPGRDKLFLGYLGTMMIPGSVTMIPVLILLRSLHLIDTYAALILPGVFSAYGTFIGSWNSFMWPLIVTNSMELKTLPIGLASFQSLYSTDWTLLMAGSLITLLPVVLLFVFNQRFFVEGIQLGAIKG